MKDILSICTITIILMLSYPSQIFGQSMVINEFMSENESVIQDEDGDFSDWIELYNNSSNPMGLLNYSLSDDSTDLAKWVFPEITIQAHHFLLVFASGKDRLDTNELHTNFKIKQSGENLFLSGPDGAVVSSINAISVPTDHSYGCFTDGSPDLCFFDFPTPNSSNTGSGDIYCSHPSGFYTEGFSLSLIPSSENHEIYYTLNGEIPTKNSLLFSSPLFITNITSVPNNISTIPTTPLDGPPELYNYIWNEPGNVYKANVIRFASFDGDAIQSQIFTKTYFIDPLIEDRFTFPVLSLVTDSLNLFEYDTGIYIPGKTFDENGFNWGWATGNYHNRGSEWERNVHVSYFENSGTLGFETGAGMRMRGYGSAASPQKSFTAYFRNEYGLNEINYNVFGNPDTNIYKRLIFRNSGNDFIQTHFKDALLQGLLKQLDLDLQDFQPSVVFFNGEYWGIHCIREKYDKYYFKYKFGIDEENINILDYCGEIKEGSNTDYLELIDFVEGNDMSLPANYLFAKNEIDVQNFIDFQIAEIYYANYDWPCNNYKIWKTNDTGSKWRFLIYDLDLSYAYDSTSLYNTPSLEHATSDVDEWPTCSCSNILFRKLLDNEEFKQGFIDRFAFHLNTTFNASSVIDSIDKFETLFFPEIEEHIDRWGYPSSLELWQGNIEILKDFTLNRPCFIQDHIMAFFNLTEFDFDCNNDIKEFREGSKLTLMPNPGSGVFYLYNNSSGTITMDILVTSISGQVVYNEKNATIQGKGKHALNLTVLSNNTYILHYYNPDFSERKKIIIID